MIDIVDDAAATVRGLEETLAQKNTVIALKNTTIERLQRETEDERTVKQNTFISLEEVIASKRSIKLPDPPIFESREQNIELWLSRMRNKFKANADHYPTDELKIAYTESRTDSEATLYITPRMRETALNQFETADEVLDLLSQIYRDSDRRHTA
jgi:SET domain-containing protein